MKIELKLHANDVTKLPDPRPASVDTALHSIDFSVHLGQNVCKLVYNGNAASVTYEQLLDLASKVATTSRVDWEYPRDSDIETTFRPIERITKCIDSTPSYQLFLAGFHIAEVIGMLSLTDIRLESVPNSFRYNLLGNIPWPNGKNGRLFFLRDGEVSNSDVQHQLLANGKLFLASMFVDDGAGPQHLEEKLFVPYANPIGFNTEVADATKDAWKRICKFVRLNGGGSAQ